MKIYKMLKKSFLRPVSPWRGSSPLNLLLKMSLYRLYLNKQIIFPLDLLRQIFLRKVGIPDESEEPFSGRIPDSTGIKT